MPDPDSVEGPVHCGVCRTVMTEHRNCDGPTSFVMSISGSKRKHDAFYCPHRNKDWHKQVVAIRNEARDTSSLRLKNMLLDEADEVLESRKATMEVSSLKGF